MKTLVQAMNEHFKQMLTKSDTLYKVQVSGEDLWETYLNGFNKKPIFRDPASSEYNCNNCKHFITHYGNIVIINNDNSITSIFDFKVPDECKDEYEKTIKDLSNLIHSSVVGNVFSITKHTIERSNYSKCYTPKYRHIGISENHKIYTQEEADKFGVVKPNQLYTFYHFYLEIPERYILDTEESLESINAKHLSDFEALYKALNEFSSDTIELAIELIKNQALLNAEKDVYKLTALLNLKKEFDLVPKSQRHNWVWKQCVSFKYCHIYGELIGTLLKDLSSKDLEDACRDWNYRVDPINYMRAQKPITKNQIKLAQQFVEENGYLESFDRRCATIDDISVSEIIHINNKSKSISIFDTLISKTTTKPIDFENIPEIPIQEFMDNILPKCTSLEAYFDNKHVNNLVTLITAKNKESKPMFKWKNNFSWTYIGDLSGKSLITQAVKNAGGFVDAPFRFSIMWNEDGRSICDLDAHCVTPLFREIFFANKFDSTSGGTLDVDMIRPAGVGVENIFWKDTSKIPDGNYEFFIVNYDCGRNSGCKAELCFLDQVWTYQIDKMITDRIYIATLSIKGGKLIDIKHSIEPIEVNKTVYNISTNQFYPVKLMCLSPNYWGDNVGNKHYFFFLEGCRTDEKLRGFHNEFLCDELKNHRKVLDVLAYSMKVEPDKNQLSGLGFNSTVKDELIVKAHGINKLFKIIF